MGYRAGNKQKQRKSEMRWLRLFMTCPLHGAEVCSTNRKPQNQTYNLPHVIRIHRIVCSWETRSHTLWGLCMGKNWNRPLIDIVSKVKHTLMRRPPLLPSSFISFCLPIRLIGAGNMAWIREVKLMMMSSIHSPSVDIFATITINNSLPSVPVCVCVHASEFSSMCPSCSSSFHSRGQCTVRYGCICSAGGGKCFLYTKLLTPFLFMI